MVTYVEPLPSPSLWQRIATRYALISRMRPRLRKARAYGNWIRANWELATRSTVIRARPLKLTVDPTNACHLRCPLCPTGRRELDRPTGQLCPALFKRLLEEVGDYVFFMDFFNWGEPLLNPHTEDLVAAAHARGIVCSLSTNLSLRIEDSRIQRLIACGLDELIVSLDGASRETYRQYRKGGDFDLVCGNLRRIVAQKRRLGVSTPLVTWQFLVFRHNEHERERAGEMAREIGVDRIAFRTPMLDAQQPELLAWVPKDEKFRLKKTRAKACSWHYVSSAVNWDGSVAPCCGVHLKGDDFGSLAGSAYMDVVNNEAYRAARKGDREGLVCGTCPVPSIQNDHRHLNRQIAMWTAVALIRRVG